jgi:Spy/CpxP family protein refolding chaperone
MFDLNSRARLVTLGALVCVAAATTAGCAHTQQAAPADSASPHGHGGWQGGRMRHGGGPRGDRMLDDLNLTKDQRSQVTLIRDRYRLKADSMRTSGAAHDSTSRSAFRSMMQQEMAEIRNVLTPDQQKQFDDKMATMRERHQQHGDRNGHDNPPPPPPE